MHDTMNWQGVSRTSNGRWTRGRRSGGFSLAEILVRASHEERLLLPGIRRRRADLLPTGALVLVAVAERLGLAGYTLCDWGLREGTLLEGAV